MIEDAALTEIVECAAYGFTGIHDRWREKPNAEPFYVTSATSVV